MVILKHISKSSGKEYLIDLEKHSCTCPHWRIRLARYGGMCKHIVEEMEKFKNDKEEYAKFILENNDAIAFEDKFGEEKLSWLKANGIVFEKVGKLFLI